MGKPKIDLGTNQRIKMHFSVGNDQKCNSTIILIKGSFSRKKKKMEPLSENPVKKIALKKTLPKIQP